VSETGKPRICAGSFWSSTPPPGGNPRVPARDWRLSAAGRNLCRLLAHRRFASALNAILEDNKGTVLVVSHGTVISLFVSRATGIDGFSLWRRLGLPSFVVLSLPGLRLKEVVEQVETSPPPT
jgi:hypothetical protein